MLEAGPLLDFPEYMNQVQAMFVYLLRQSLCLLQDKEQILKLSPSSFATLILTRLFSSQAFSLLEYLSGTAWVEFFEKQNWKEKGNKM